jgi:hypothetical protein
MKDQHKMIYGKNDLNAETIDLINRIKAHGEETAKLVEEVQRRTAKQYNAARGVEDKQAVAVDAMGWEEEGKRHLQMGFMFLTRAVAQPSTFA